MNSVSHANFCRGKVLAPVLLYRVAGFDQSVSPHSICDSKDKKKYDIQWVKAGNLLVADRNLLKNVSWEQLDTWGLVFGDNQKPIHKEPRKQSFEDLVSRAQSLSDQLAELTSDLQKHKDNLER